MTNQQRAMAVLNYKNYDRLPIVHFGFWFETLYKWADEGYITIEEANYWADGTPVDKMIGDRLGFDFNWYNCFHLDCGLRPEFGRKVIKELPDGSKHVLDLNGVIVLERDGAGSIPAEIDHTLKDRKSWQEQYLPKLQFSEERILKSMVNTGTKYLPYDQGGLEFLLNPERENPIGLHCGSLFGVIRNWLGVQGVSYLLIDDPDLYDEIIDTVGQMSFNCVKYVLSKGAKFDFAHFWEDICFKNGPLVIPSVFDAKVGPYYKKITALLNEAGINIISLDCDGLIDTLIPTWFGNGVNTMFPIEVGTWGAEITSWRNKFGRELRGVGGMDKTVFSKDYAAVDAEIERLKPLVALGGYIPCPDHRIAPDAKWDNICYYCEKMREVF